MVLSLLLLSFLLGYVQPAIASVSKLDRRQASADSSNTRSLSSIVSGCFATIFACTWMSVHSNIPAPTDSDLKVLGRRLAMMLHTLIAPGFVIAWAARQYIASREIHRRHKARGWTKTHAFFVIMGGFSLYENGKLVRTLDIFELEKLWAEGKVDWPIITEEEIKDKSKNDYFSKGVVVVQTCWFIAQVITRFAKDMLVTGLEVVTLAYSVLTIILYFLWWNKPLDVSVSVPVHLKNGFSIPLEVAPTTSPLPVHQEIRRLSSRLWAIPSDVASTTFPTLVHQEFRRILSRLRTVGRHFSASGTPTADGIPTIHDTGSHQSTDRVERLECQENEAARPIFISQDRPLVSSPQDIEMQALPLESGNDIQSTRSSSQHDSASVRSSANSSKSNRLVRSLAISLVIFLAIFLALVGVLVGIAAVLYLFWKLFIEYSLVISDMLACQKLNTKHPTRVPTFYCPKSESEKKSYSIAKKAHTMT